MAAGRPCRFPPEFGGQGLPELVAAATNEIWQSANMAFALCPMLTEGCAVALGVHGSDDLKEIYLPKFIAGEWAGTMNLTEPQAGSDFGRGKDQGRTQRRSLPVIRSENIYHVGRS